MILSGLLSLVSYILDFVFDLLPDIPSLPVTVTSTIDTVLDLIFDHAGFIGFFLDLSLVRVLLPLVLVVANFEHIYHFALWILKKIPFSACIC